jgi:hypothetical protein
MHYDPRYGSATCPTWQPPCATNAHLPLAALARLSLPVSQPWLMQPRSDCACHQPSPSHMVLRIRRLSLHSSPGPPSLPPSLLLCSALLRWTHEELRWLPRRERDKRRIMSEGWYRTQWGGWAPGGGGR